MPNFDWGTYLAQLQLGVDELNQPMPNFFAELDTMLSEVALDDWKTYLRWHLISSMAGALSSDIEHEDFHFYTTVLAGVPEMEPPVSACSSSSARARSRNPRTLRPRPRQ